MRRELIEIYLPEQPRIILQCEAQRLGMTTGELVELLLLNLRRLL